MCVLDSHGVNRKIGVRPIMKWEHWFWWFGTGQTLPLGADWKWMKQDWDVSDISIRTLIELCVQLSIK